MERLTHNNPEIENRQFAEVFAFALLQSGITPNYEMCERWLREGFVNEVELEDILEAYENATT